jgi:hypothetical protein
VTRTKVDTEDVAQELAGRLADSEAARERLVLANGELQDEVDRFKRSVEGFMAENEALKGEIAGTGKSPRKVNKDSNTTLPGSRTGTQAERLTRALLEAARKGAANHG